MPKNPEDITEQLTPDDIARAYELEQTIAPLQQELDDLKIRFKNELPVGEYPSKNGFLVKRWEQMSTFKSAEFLAEKPVSENPELYRDDLNLDLVREKFPVDANPELYVKLPDTHVIKELLNDEEKRAYFRQAQYLKITPKPKGKPSTVPNFEQEDPEDA